MTNCLQCGLEISKRKKFCDSSCAAKYNNSRRKHSEGTKAKIRASVLSTVEVYTKQCVCGDTFKTGSRTAKRCGRCQRLNRAEKDRQRGLAKNSCPVCGAAAVRKYCSVGCSQKSRLQKTAQSIEAGTYRIASDTLAALRRYLFNVRGRRCEVCSITEWCGRPVPVEVDHLNGNCKDHSVGNLRLVCGNCAMQLPTYKSKNKDNSKRSRK